MRAVMAESVNTGICMLIGLEPLPPAPALFRRTPVHNSEREAAPAHALPRRMLFRASSCFFLHVMKHSMLLSHTHGRRAWPSPKVGDA